MRLTLIALYALWGAWAISWAAAAFWADRAVARPDVDREWRYRRFTIPGWVLLLGAPIAGLPIDPAAWHSFWHLSATAEWGMVGLATMGCVLTWWARIHLGRLWSAGITRKAEHRVIDSGPYAVVRHPIYVGLCLAALATLMIRANLAVALGLAFLLIGYWVKAREEERFLEVELGSDAYGVFRRRVPMLVPFMRC